MLREYILILAESILHKTCINYNMAFITKKNIGNKLDILRIKIVKFLKSLKLWKTIGNTCKSVSTIVIILSKIHICYSIYLLQKLCYVVVGISIRQRYTYVSFFVMLSSHD